MPAPLDGPGVGVSDPRDLVLGYLDWYRDALLRKISGLSDAQLRTPVQPLGWSPLGLVRHLGWVERRWMRWGFAAEEVLAYPAGGDEEEWRVADGEKSADVMGVYLEEVRQARALAEHADLGEVARVGGRFATLEQAPSLGRILFHLLQEYARHVGQLDVARELIDGVTGE
ncbi:DinB family protein [Streptomyces beijiangensis]